jgi:hypothetical protein
MRRYRIKEASDCILRIEVEIAGDMLKVGRYEIRVPTYLSIYLELSTDPSQVLPAGLGFTLSYEYEKQRDKTDYQQQFIVSRVQIEEANNLPTPISATRQAYED